MAVDNAGKKENEVSERESSEYVQTMGISISVLALVSSFVYTAMTLILIEVEDVSALLWQSTLLILFFSFTIFLLLTYMHLVRILVMRGSRRYPKSPKASKLPQARVLNLLETLGLNLWWVSMIFMFLAKNLIYLALTSFVTMMVVWFPFGYLLLLKPLLTKESTSAEGG